MNDKVLEPRIFKIIVVGDSNVGKTCLTYRFCQGSFPVGTEATIGVDFREKRVEVADETLRLQCGFTDVEPFFTFTPLKPLKPFLLARENILRFFAEILKNEQ